MENLIGADLRKKFLGLRDEHVERLEEMWSVVEPFMDSNFKSDLHGSFHQRVWELYLAFTLHQQGAKLKPREHQRDEGPDFFVEAPDALWIEAISPNDGEGDDAVPENPITDPPTVYTVPEEQVKLRYTAAICEKQRKHECYMLKGVVGVSDPYVIALSGGAVNYGRKEAMTPRILCVLFGIGKYSVTLGVSQEETKVVDEGPTQQQVIMKRSGSEVSSRLFFEEAYARVSGVLFSASDAGNYPSKAGADFLFVHNPLAKNPLPQGWLGVGSEYHLESRSNDRLELKSKDW